MEFNVAVFKDCGALEEGFCEEVLSGGVVLAWVAPAGAPLVDSAGAALEGGAVAVLGGGVAAALGGGAVACALGGGAVACALGGVGVDGGGLVAMNLRAPYIFT